MKEINWREKNLISIDFDGVLSHYNGWKGVDVLGDPIKGAKEFILMIKNSGFTPIIFTTRKPELIKNWLKKFEFLDLEVSNVKYPSIVYIDDRCVKFNGNFSNLIKDLKNYNVYWREGKRYFDELDISK